MRQNDLYSHLPSRGTLALPRVSSRNLTGMSQWSEELVSRFARAIRARRKALGLSAQDVADRTSELGHPIGRSAIAAWENNSRGDRIMLADALVLAEALNMPVAGLLYPDMPDGEVEAVPGVDMRSIDAAMRLVGDDRSASARRHPSRARDHWHGATDVADVYVLTAMSTELATLRGERAAFQRAYEDAIISGGDIDHPRRMVESLDARITELVGRIRDAGGVVNDG